MDSHDLTREQATTLSAAIRPMLEYLYRLKGRMEQTGFPRDDEVYVLVVKAHDDIQRLAMTLHYKTCEGSVWRPGVDERKRP